MNSPETRASSKFRIHPLSVRRHYGTTVTALLLAAALGARAGSFSSDFNTGLPTGSTVYGVAAVAAADGFTNSGCLKLTTATGSVQGSFVITNDFDSAAPVYAFTAKFKALVGGGSGADGFSFVFAPDLPGDGNFAEEGAGLALSVCFDTWANDPTGGSDLQGIDVKANGWQMGTLPWSGLRANTWVDVLVQLHPDGTLDVTYDGYHAYTNLALSLPLPITGGRFGLGSRTGGSTDNHWIDNLSIVTYTNGTAFTDYAYPIGRRVRADTPIQIVLSDAFDISSGTYSQVDTNTIVLQLDGGTVVPEISQSAPLGVTLTQIRYQPASLFPSGSTHNVHLTFSDNATPTPRVVTWDHGFSVAAYSTLEGSLAADPSLVSANAGFNLRISQIDAHLGNTISRAESQLANQLINPGTGQPYLNQATLSSYNESGVVNYSKTGAQGNFRTEAPNSIPGLPGSTGGSTNAALEAITYLQLTPGLYTLGINSSDGFRLTTASTPDLFASSIAAFDGVRAAADSTVTFSVTQAGYYPFRICYMVGGLEAVNPTTDNPSLEFFSEDALGVKTLINDANASGRVPAFRPAQTLPYIRSANPAPDSTGVPSGTAIDIVLVDGSLAVQPGNIELLVNSVLTAPVFSSSGGITTVHYQPPAHFTPNSTNTIQIAFSDSAGTRRTNSWKFAVENILTQLWVIPPNSANATWAKWVTSGSTERGVAFNPKTGHVLLVSRSAATGADGPAGLGIGILDGNTGAYLGKMNTAGVSADTDQTFRLNLIEVAEDGVIYACNLATATNHTLRIYRWQDEAAAPTLAWSGNPMGASTRWGDVMRLRGSGAGTEILVSGNSAVNTAPLFTTVDGVNFSPTILTVQNLPANSVRLGLGFGCGNTFYGATTATPLQYVGFDGPPSTIANRLQAFEIRDGLGAQSIGAVGVDVANQRLIGNGTSQTTGNTHSMNLFDLPSLSTSSANTPLDYKVFGTRNGNFGTGAISFTPDGSRVYTLDTGNGIIAFSLAPKLAAPNICAQPRNFIVPALGALGFMDVRAIGSPQTYQWRRNGTPLPGATNRTLDLPGLQQNQLGFYSVIVSNSMGSVTSQVAYLDTRMVINSQPQTGIIPVGGSTTLSVAVTAGLPPYTYQWKLNGADLVGAVQSSLVINDAQQEDAGAYLVTITDSLGQSIVSQPAIVTVGTLGTGTGLSGSYWNLPAFSSPAPAHPFYGPPTITRVDATVDFDWGEGSPDYSIGLDYFSARWRGQIQPLYSQTYTFYTTSDDGTWLWINGQLVVANWYAQPPTERSGTITLAANTRYDLLMEYYERGGGAVARLNWSSPNQVKQIVPATQLYPGDASPLQPSLTSTLSNSTNLVLNWVGTFILESAPEASGPWTPVLTNAGPYTVPVTGGPQQFFRLLSEN